MKVPVIEVSDLSKRYDLGEISLTALSGISLSVEHGEFVAIMGASGSGKSTLMNLLGCLDKPTSGSYRLEGIAITDLDDASLALIRRLKVGFVFQNYNLLSRTTALENVELPLIYSGTLRQGGERAADSLRLIGLGDRLQHFPNQLSGGQQQRVAIARALVNNPAILLADEPTGNLDSKSSQEIVAVIRRLNRERGLTVVLVTHEAQIAEQADRIITLRDGTILSDVPSQFTRANSLAQPQSRLAPLFLNGSTPTHSGSKRKLLREEGPALKSAFAAMMVQSAWSAIRRNRLRAGLAVLGILIGVSALIATVNVSREASQNVRKQIEGLGTNLLIVFPEQPPHQEPAEDSGANRRSLSTMPRLFRKTLHQLDLSPTAIDS
jgi:macrolide transport system ATP-binding/permease protein